MTKQEIHTLKMSIRSSLKSLMTDLDNIKSSEVLSTFQVKINQIKTELGSELIDQHLKEVELLRAKIGDSLENQ